MNRRLRRIKGHLKTRLLIGAITSGPLLVTFWALKVVLEPLDHLLSFALVRLAGVYIPGVGVVALLTCIYGTGAIAATLLGRRLIDYAEGLLLRVPLAGLIYRTVREVVHKTMSSRQGGRGGVVTLEYPRRGVRALGFVTGSIHLDPSGRHLLVLVPMTPIPPPGIATLTLVPEGEVTPLNLPLMEGIRWAFSGGILAPERVDLRGERGQGRSVK